MLRGAAGAPEGAEAEGAAAEDAKADEAEAEDAKAEEAEAEDGSAEGASLGRFAFASSGACASSIVASSSSWVGQRRGARAVLKRQLD